jgi:eukaryotic-like serine/threonine-protein kinase
MLLSVGTRLGPYEILSAIGAGGMGEVYRARDPRLGRDVAIKVLPAAFSLDPDRLQRFEQEARAAAALNHPHILAVYDIGQHGGAPYIVSELLEGETLRTAGTAPLPVRKAIDLAIQLARGLAAAHAKGVVHRDLKPANIFVTSDGRVRILDFGLAKLTAAEPAQAGARALPGTEGADAPFWSPDGRSVGFFAAGKVKRADVSGASAPQVLADAPNQRGGTWSRDGVIVFSPAPRLPLYRVSAAGGAAVPLRLDKADEGAPDCPSFLPDGRHFLFKTPRGPEAGRGVWVGSLDSTPVVRVGNMRSRVTYSSGYLLFGCGRELYAQPFDPARLQLSGEPIRLAENLGISFGPNYAFSTSSSDVLVYGTGVSAQTRQPRWLDRRGASLGAVGEPGLYVSLVLSADERRIAVERFDPATSTYDVWTTDVGTGATSRLTADPDESSICPLWAADGESVLFRTSMAGTLRVTSLDGKKTDDISVGGAGTGAVFPTAWSSDGRFVVFNRSDQKTLSDLWLVPLTGDRTPRPYLQTRFNEFTGRISPDSRWLAYVSDESGRAEIYVQSFPVPGSKQRVSTSGGRQPQWDKRGTELYYLSLDGKLMAATVSRARPSLELSPPRALFDAPQVAGDSARSPYAVTADGQRFLFNAVTTDALESGIVVGIHWPAALKQ